jgi:hypothetical protein
MRVHELEMAERIVLNIEPEDPHLVGRLYELQERYEDAAEAFERAEAFSDALRNWRNAGRWEMAAELAEGREQSDLQWLIAFEDAVQHRPPDQDERLTKGERDRLTRLLATVRTVPRIETGSGE